MEIRLIDDSEWDESNKFHNKIYQKNRSLAQWKWDFIDNTYHPETKPFAVVVDNGKIVGTQALIPIKMIDIDGVFWTAKSEETLVDPNYRGKQLFEKMYRFIFEYAKEHDFRYIWGFTPATKAFKRLNFNIPYETQQIFIPFSARFISMASKAKADLLKKIVYKSGILCTKIISSIKLSLEKPKREDFVKIINETSPPDEAGDVAKKFISQFGGKSVFRDKEYLDWRLFKNPYVKSIFKSLYVNERLVGWVAYALGDDGVGYLVDIIAVEDESKLVTLDESIKMLLYEAVIGTRDMGATGIRGWSVTGHSFDSRVLNNAQELGFFKIAKGHAAVIYKTDNPEVLDDTDEFDNWYITRIFTEGVLG